MLIIEKIKDPEERLFYVMKIIDQGWSRTILQEYIVADFYHKMPIQNNFSESLGEIKNIKFSPFGLSSFTPFVFFPMLISHLTADHVGQTITLKGWIVHTR